MVAQAQRHAVGGAAQLGHLGRRQRARRQRQAGPRPTTPDGPGWNATCTSGAWAIARSAPAVARLKSSARPLSLAAAHAYSTLRVGTPVGMSSLKQRW